MNENQMTLKQAKQLFGLWDNAYHESALKNCDPARRWDPAKFANMRKKKLEKVEESSEEESDGMLVRVISKSSKVPDLLKISKITLSYPLADVLNLGPAWLSDFRCLLGQNQGYILP